MNQAEAEKIINQTVGEIATPYMKVGFSGRRHVLVEHGLNGGQWQAMVGRRLYRLEVFSPKSFVLTRLS